MPDETNKGTPPTDPLPTDTPLTGRVARGAAWIMGAGLFARTLGALNMIVVARLLAPDDIGLVAVATVAMQLLQGLSDIGVSQAVVKFRDADRDDLDTLFTLSCLRGILVGVLLALAAPLMAHFYNDPRMLGVFLGVAAFPVIMGFINPRFYEFERDLSFSREFISTVLNKFTGVIVSLVVAFTFRTYWAIILGLLAGGIVQLFLSYAMRPHLPRLSFKSLNKVLGFSGWVAGVSFMAALNNKLDVPIIARAAGAGAGGIYFMGFQLSEIITGQIALPFTRAIYPGLATLQSDPDRMRRAFLRGVAALGAVAMPAAFGFAFVAEDAVNLLLGEQWSRAVFAIQVLAPIIGLQSLFYASQSYAMAAGLVRLVFWREFVFFIVRLPIFIWAVVNYGLTGAVYAAAGLGVFHIALNLALYSRVSGRGFLEPVLSARRSIAAVAAMTIWFLGVRPHLGGMDDWPLVFRLGADAVTGGAICVLTQWGLWRLEGRPDGIERNILAALSSLKSKIP